MDVFLQQAVRQQPGRSAKVAGRLNCEKLSFGVIRGNRQGLTVGKTPLLEHICKRVARRGGIHGNENGPRRGGECKFAFYR